jgi:phosphate transport system substrate-binding protein
LFVLYGWYEQFTHIQIMNQNLSIFALGAIAIVALVGLPSCSTDTNTPTTSATTSSSTTAASNAQASLKVGSGSSTIDLLKTLKTAYESTSKKEQINLLEPAQSENIVAGVKQGVVDVGVITKNLEDDTTIEYRHVAKDALLVATHSSVTGVKNLTTENLKAIYSGSATNWKQFGGPDAAIVVLDRPEDESAKRLLRKHYLGKDLQNAPKAVVLRKEGELIQTLQSTPNSIGAFSLAYTTSHNLPVNRLSLNNIEPTLENLKTGKYLMVRTIGVVWSKAPSDATQSFVNYILSQTGNTVLEQAGFAPIAQVPESKNK